MSQEYDANCYYGDEPFLKISSFETEKNKIESRLDNLESRNKALEWNNKALTVSMTVFLVFLLIGTVTMLIFHELIIEQINNNLILKEHKVKVASMNSEWNEESKIMQRRQDFGEPREDFYRNWTDYKLGFGDSNREFWLGNENIYQLTKFGNAKLRVELEAHDGRTAWAEYDTFR